MSLQSIGLNVQAKPTDSLLPPRLPAAEVKEYASKTIDNTELHVRLNQYQPETLREKIIPYFESLYNTEEWQNDPRATPVELKELGYKVFNLRRTGGQNFAIFIYRFEIGEYNTNNYEIAKLLQIPATFTGRRYFNIMSIHSLCSEPSCANELASATQIALNWDTTTKKLR
ncbi:hypothetical protein GCM10011613_28630 [Cellvibrio zantedeschiae]|uniref:Uncharacterized protein n=1 Tax=Cellvibrio zantedeschiae TaxID=1237077 RepID=A0ABQ3B8B3_9GAMM|nr:hypothetical protein GCM10011613_28630 [Cellvibrio zantedeschiae]